MKIENFGLGIPSLYKKESVDNRVMAMLESVRGTWMQEQYIQVMAQEWPSEEIQRLKDTFKEYPNLHIYERGRVPIAPDIRLEMMKASKVNFLHIIDDDRKFSSHSKAMEVYENAVSQSLQAFKDIPELNSVSFQFGGMDKHFNKLTIGFSARTCSQLGRIYSIDRILNTAVEEFFRLCWNIEDVCYGASVALSGGLCGRIKMTPNIQEVKDNSSSFNTSGKPFGVSISNRLWEMYYMFAFLDDNVAEYERISSKYDDKYNVVPGFSLFYPGPWHEGKLKRVFEERDKFLESNPESSKFETIKHLMDNFHSRC